MGNCVLKGLTIDSPGDTHVSTTEQAATMIKVVTTNGGIMELYAPITAEQITSEFPGYGLFHTPDPTQSHPLLHNDHLNPGHLYYLLPLSLSSTKKQPPSYATTPYRMSFDAPRVVVKRASDVAEVAPSPRKQKGVWKVRLVINPEQLSEILSQDAKTEELIESVRTVAKCGNNNNINNTNAGFSTSSVASSNNSDQSNSVQSTCKFQWKASL